ncbi:hypothetical protein MTR_4g043930 [Medicago truncatula]|uniref:Uncharacterized protein n=1 Tax=Medicago truncatula TaxID=3880 RepID=G7JVU9_MEDTR|nr:hypothetical protein MTR_4g043930 [Medicago truncatula]
MEKKPRGGRRPRSAAIFIYKTNFGIKFGHWEVKLGFLGEKLVFPESCTATASSVPCSCVFFTRFRFELGAFLRSNKVEGLMPWEPIYAQRLVPHA